MQRHLLPFILLVVPLAAGAGPAYMQRPIEYGALREFTAAVDRYAEMRRTVAAALEPAELCADPEEIQRGVDRLAEAIRAERATAQPGDVFTPAVGMLFQRRIAEAAGFDDDDVAALPKHLAGGYLPDDVRLEVNGTFPWTAGYETFPAFVVNLPPLPEELEYRLAGRDLVLLDVGANLIVDILYNVVDAAPGAAPRATPETGVPGGPCLVHPELRICWT